MKTQRFALMITVLNLILLLSLLPSWIRTVEVGSSAPMLRGSGLQIVDPQGKVRAAIEIEPAGPQRFPDGSVAKDGKIYPETVRLRLIRPDGRPSVKITTSEDGSGLTLGGGVDPTYVVVDASGGNPSLSLINKDGKQQLIKP